jgi:hypothetical protein
MGINIVERLRELLILRALKVQIVGFWRNFQPV